MSEIREELQDLLREFFDDPGLVVSRSLQASDVDGWDSLAHLNLVATLEERFGVKFRLAEIHALRHVGDLIDLLCRHTGRP